MEAPTPGQVVAELLAVPLSGIEEARAAAPAVAGFYAWWCEADAVPGDAPAPPHPAEPYRLLYVGIAPNGSASAGNLRKRLRQHSSAKIGSSTFRRSLTALLWKQEGWRPAWTDRPVLCDADLAALGRWQRQHLRVRWAETAEPWSMEAEVIGAMEPALNRAHNQRHPFHTSMGVALNELRRAARSG